MIQELDIAAIGDVAALRNVLLRVKQNGEQYILKEHGQAEAGLISLDDLAVLKRAKDSKEKAWRDFFANLADVHARNPHFSAEEVEADVDAAIQEIRRESRN